MGDYLPMQNVSLITYLIDNQLIKVIIGCSEQQPSNKNVKKQRETPCFISVLAKIVISSRTPAQRL